MFEELSGGLETRSAEEWLKLADGGDLVYAGYNDAIGYGELVCVTGGKLVRQFLQYEQDPSADTDCRQATARGAHRGLGRCSSLGGAQ